MGRQSGSPLLFFRNEAVGRVCGGGLDAMWLGGMMYHLGGEKLKKKNTRGENHTSIIEGQRIERRQSHPTPLHGLVLGMCDIVPPYARKYHRGR